MQQKRLITAILCLGSTILLVCWGALNLTFHTGSDATWIMSHIFLMAGYMLLFVGALLLHVLIRRKAHNRYVNRLALGGISLVILGVMAFIGQMAIDLIVGYLAQNQAAMNSLFDGIHDRLGLHLAFYAVGPSLFYVGLLILVLLAYRVHALGARAALLPALGITLIGIAFGIGGGSPSAPLYPIGLMCLIIGFLPLGQSKSPGN